MTDFLTRLIGRYQNPVNNVSPQARGRYEPRGFSYDLQKKAESGHSLNKEKNKGFVNTIFSNPVTAFSIDKVKTAENLPESGEGALHPPSWASNLNSGSTRNTVIKEIHVESSPTIKVNIGRIEVRAVMQQAPAPMQIKGPPEPKLSLPEYLNQQNHDKK